MSKIESLEDTAKRLLNPNKILSPLVFDYKKIMFPDLRQKLLEMATCVFEETAGQFEGAKIEDIFLIGSMSGYNYTESSDYDVAITINFDDCPFLKFENETAKIKFLIFLYANAQNKLPNFTLNKKLVDISLKTNILLKNYSILHNHWINEDCKVSEYKTVNELVSGYYYCIEEYANFMQKFKTINGKYSVEDYNKMLDYYLSIVVFNNNKDLNSHIIYKLLIKHDIISKIGQNITNSLNYTLSLYK